MTDAELDAVCALHGILTVHDEDGWHAGVVPGGDIYDLQQCLRTREDAVCGLLKARWGITTGWYRHTNDGKRWVTQCDALCDQHEYDTELAAVVALADRLAGVAT